ncbi:shikimate kinase [Thermocoleostomius sinensis A174]|uniref:Shikimate kinase n=2 Tax=Thermocoleostomius TaxID=3065395 RepID=A0A9E9C623_9CYAN|nr:shikimate kinase [Thermocoleostomius sinensis A174]
MSSNLLQGLNLYLIGMMGSGKSTVGKILATQLGYHFFDTDAVIEQAAEQSIADIFTNLGEPTFRELESQVLAELSAYTKLVIATGGGIVLQQMNWSYLRHGLIVWLDVGVDQLSQRLSHDRTRPLLAGDNPRQKLTDLLHQRQSLYAQADLHIHVEDQESPTQVADRILSQIPSVLKATIASSEQASQSWKN